MTSLCLSFPITPLPPHIHTHHSRVRVPQVHRSPAPQATLSLGACSSLSSPALSLPLQALQAPACHENMVKVGGYILGEFGNLIAGDPRSR